jgi:hypothetical protein
VPDRGDVELAQAGEDLPREHQQHEIDGGQHAREPGAADQRDHDGRHHHIGRAHVGQVPVRGGELAGIDPVGDDALADQGSDHVPGQADQRRPDVAEGPVRAEERQRDQHRPGPEVPGRNEGRDQQRADRLVLQVGHVRAGPGDQPGLSVRIQQGVGELDGEEAAQVRHGEAVTSQQNPHRHLSWPGLGW